MQKHRKLTGALALGSAGALALTGCASGGEGGEGGDESKGEIILAAAAGWEEGIAVSEMWALILQDRGYDAKVEYADVGPIYQGVADGDYDIFLDAWLPLTHASYMESYGDQLVELGTWNDEAKLTIAVNEDAPIDSLDELADNAETFGNRIIGIEAGAGLTQITQEEVIPTYGLEDMEYVISSTPAMLSELRSATDSGENIAVTLWRPHWAYSAYPLKDLEDPEGALGEAEGMVALGTSSIEEDLPEVAGWIQEFKMDSDTLYSLEDVLFNQNDDPDAYSDITREWMEENQEYVDSLTP